MSSQVLNQPETKDALIVTLNSKGYMLSQPEQYIQAFIDFSAHAPGPVLDIGAAYGVATLPALEKGAYVIANDLDKRHLQILQQKTPSSLLDHLEIKAGKMPYELDFEANSLGAVLTSRIFTFILPEEFELSLEKIFKWLKPGGKLFYLGGTPYMGTFKNHLPTYLRRKEEGHPWPGLIDDVSFCTPERACDLPRSMHLIDEDVLYRNLIKYGFTIEKMGYSPARDEHPEDLKFDGRELLGAIAYKA